MHMRPVTPRGFRDVLPEEAGEREALGRLLGDVFSAWGYGLVETPVVERLDALEAAAGPLEGTAFRLVDLDGRLLALRPDVTVPIARLVASRMAGQPGPHRLRYCSSVFREHESLRGQSRQFTQVGVELVGAKGPAADAEIVALLAEALRAAGLKRFDVAMGTVAVFQAIVDSAGATPQWGDEVFAAAHDRNLVELDRLAGQPAVAPEAAAALRAVPRIRGGSEAIAACRLAASGCGCERALDDLQATFDLLEAAGVADKVTVDFSVMRSFDYYTGLVVEAYAPGLGVALGGGGRYDGVLARFDAPAPAAGFALGLERVSIALVEQGETPHTRGLDALIGGDPARALSAAATLRTAGWHVALSAREGIELVREAERTGAVEALLATEKGVLRLDRAGEVALPLEQPAPYPPTTSWAQGGEL
jgi:ATP phosphoribosyltransferase regulatory subunit